MEYDVHSWQDSQLSGMFALVKNLSTCRISDFKNIKMFICLLRLININNYFSKVIDLFAPYHHVKKDLNAANRQTAKISAFIEVFTPAYY